jgi:hypothetical protein
MENQYQQEMDAIKMFDINSDQVIFINVFKCFYHGGNIPIPSKVYIFSDRIGLCSKLNSSSFFGSQTKLTFMISKIVMSEINKTLGQILVVHMDDGTNHKFSGLGSGLETAHKLISGLLHVFKSNAEGV